MSRATPIADLIEYAIGGGWGEESPSETSLAGAFVIRGTDIPRAVLGDVSTVPYRYHKSSNLERRILQPLDIVFEVSGGSKGQPVGRVVLVSQRLLDSFGEPAMCASFCKLIRLDPSRCDPRFVYRSLQYEYRSGGLDPFQVQSTGITNFRWKPFLEQFEIVLPSRVDQERVADILSAIDGLIENNRRRVEVLEEMARVIYREWFVHFRYPGHEDIPLVDSELGPIPEGWEVVPASELLEINPKVPLHRGTRCRQMAMGDLDEQVMNCQPSGWKDSPSGSKFVNGDTLFARITPCLENGKTGFMQALDDGEAACGSTEFIVLRGRYVGPSYVYLLARDVNFRGHAIASMSGASGRQRVRNECFDSFLIPKPLPEVAAEFESVATPLFRHSWSLHLQVTALSELRDLLLPKLVTGQIDVSNLDLDGLIEAASL